MPRDPQPDVPATPRERVSRRAVPPTGDRPIPIPRSIELPARGHLHRTSEVDFVDHYYQGGMGWVLRERLRWVESALARRPVDAMLEIGYGSGVFMYTLARHARAVFGIEIHGHGSTVRERLREDAIDLTATRGSGMALPFRDASFDAVVIVSALEFMDDPLSCLTEARRVTRPGCRQRVQAALNTLPFPCKRRPRPRPLPAALAPYELVVINL